MQAVLDAGARGFLLKSDAARDLVTAVEALQHNKTFFTARVAELVLSGFLSKSPRSSKGDPGRVLPLASAKWCNCWRRESQPRKWPVIST